MYTITVYLHTYIDFDTYVINITLVCNIFSHALINKIDSPTT